MSSVLAKIRALVARAASDHEEEARTSAVLACRQMLEHKIVLTLPGAVEEKTDEELRASAWEYIQRRQRQASAYDPRYGVHAAAQARARGYARGARESDGEESRPPHRHTSPFDPYAAPFETVRDYVKSRGVDVHDNGDGSFSARMGASWCKGSWRDVVRFMFSLLETGRADVFWRGV